MMHEQESLDIVSRQTNRSVEENRNSKDRSIHREATDFWQRVKSNSAEEGYFSTNSAKATGHP